MNWQARALQALFLCCLLLAHWPAVANWPSAPIAPMYVLVDAHGQETIETVSSPARQASFQLLQGDFAAGFSPKVYWFRLELDPPQIQQQYLPTLLLEARPTYLDDLRFYLPDPLQPGRFIAYQHGDRFPFSQRVVPSLTFVQPVNFVREEPKTIYIRLNTSSSDVLKLRVWKPASFHGAVVAEYALLGVLLGAFALALLGQLPAAVSGNDAWSRPFLLYTAAATLVVLFLHGLAGQFIFPKQPFWADHLVPVSSTLLIVAATAFYRKVLRLRECSLWADRFFLAVIALGVLSLPSNLLGFYDLVANWLFVCMLCVLLLSAVRSVHLLWLNEPDSRGVLITILVTMAGGVPAVLSLLGWINAGYLEAYAYLGGIFGSVLAMQWVLMQRARRAQWQAQASQQAQARAEAIAQEHKSMAEQQRRFIDMLSHEFKSPLSVLRMRLGSTQPSPGMQEHAIQAVHDMDALVERIGLASRLEHANLNMQACALSVHDFLPECIAALGAAASRVRLELPPIAPDKPLVWADPLWLRVVFQNLLDNAIKYSPPEAPVHIQLFSRAASTGQGGWGVRIGNQPGVAGKPNPAKVFAKYYRSPAAHHTVGTGLGLYIAVELARAMGGQLAYLAEEPDVVFELWLPAQAHEHSFG